MKIISNLAISLDGKIATQSRVYFPLGTRNDMQEMLRLRSTADAILIGASTLRAYKKASLAARGTKQPVNVILSASLEGLSPRWPFFRDPRVRRVLFTTPRAAKSSGGKFAGTCEVIALSPGSSFVSQAIRRLSRMGISQLIVEGGGSVMWEFACENRIDEYHVTLTPRILGGSRAPTLVDGRGFEPGRVLNLKLVSCRKKANELFLVYRKTSKRGP